MHLSHLPWSNDPGVLVFLPLYTSQLQMPKILKTSIHKGETGSGKTAECEQSF